MSTPAEDINAAWKAAKAAKAAQAARRQAQQPVLQCEYLHLSRAHGSVTRSCSN